jgi:hypothetical protein
MCLVRGEGRFQAAFRIWSRDAMRRSIHPWSAMLSPQRGMNRSVATMSRPEWKIFNLPYKRIGIKIVLAMEFASSGHQGKASSKRADDSYLTIKFVEVWRNELS